MAPGFINIEPLRRFPDFRRLWTGYLFRLIGAQLTVTTCVYQLFALTHSNLDVGLLSLAQAVPAIAAAIIGGSIADAIDRRKLLIATAVLFAILTAGLALNAMQRQSAVWPLFVISPLIWGLNAVDTPTRSAVIITLVDRESVVPANVLRQLLSQASNLLGPALAGLLIALYPRSLAAIYWIDVASTLAAFQAVVRLPAMPSADGARRFGLSSMREGFGFALTRPPIMGGIAADFVAMFFASPVSLFPYLALVRYHGGPGAFGLLSAAPAFGAATGALLSGWTARVYRNGRWIIYAFIVWGLAMVGLGLSPWLWLGAILAAIAGWVDSTSAIFRATILQLETPDRLRGRLSSIDSMVGQTGPLLGRAEAGLIAQFISVPSTLILGGIACIAGIGVIARTMPGFGGYVRSDSLLAQESR
jgi:MFS family permease